MNNYDRKSTVAKTLEKIGAIRRDRIELFSTKTRDNSNLEVFRDHVTGVIYINNHYVGDSEYVNGEYHNNTQPLTPYFERNYEDLVDSERRFKSYRQLLSAKFICDFGCGSGTFLKHSKSVAKRVFGVELQKSHIDNITNAGIDCYSSIHDIREQLDVVTLFHCLEHLADPATTLNDLYGKLKSHGDGVLIIEVPHARDFLIENLRLQDFIDFTLWSQHLVLHTRESLRLLLADSGFKNIVIEGVQRYSIANHLHWLSKKKPGGHKSILSTIQTPELVAAYEMALARIDATDTIVAIATT